jgi:predicted ATPase/class 3 adenylate cyclase
MVDKQNSSSPIFLFTDVEGSTKLWEQYPEQMAQALARHDAIAAVKVTEHGGMVVKSRGEGDSLFIVFSNACHAVDAACSLQLAFSREKWPAEITLRVRMALHTGEAQLRAGDYYGSAVNRAARLRAIAHGGQTVLSQAIADLVNSSLSDGAWLEDMGSHGLKDLQQPEHVWQLCHPALEKTFPPLRSESISRHNLPIETTTFVGREQAIADVKRMLGSTRLLTLTGSGGSGKTRLAMHVAVDLLDSQRDGVWLVELAPITDPALIPQTIASNLGIREQIGRGIMATLLDHLKTRSMLMVLDNCEHLLTDCARLADTIIRSCPNVRILASSREPLSIPGESVYRVPSLSLPDPANSTPDSLIASESALLFIDRAKAVSPIFAVTEQNAVPLAQICVRLDGIPLALELAAARVNALPIEQIAARLHDRFRLLTGGSRTALPRQQTLRALIDWSYDLLNTQEKMLMRRLSVFMGGWSLEAAEAICVDDSIESWEVLDLLTSLVNKSLVVYEDQALGGRYRLLETVRQYARDRLLESGEGQLLRDRHTQWFLELAVKAETLLRGNDQSLSLNRLELEHDNLRAAHDWCLDSPDHVVAAMEMVGALWLFWELRGYFKEGRTRCVSSISRPDTDASPAALANALNGAGNICQRLGDYDASLTYHHESLKIRRELDDKRGIAASLHNIANICKAVGDIEEAKKLYNEALVINQEMKNVKWQMYNLTSLGNVARDEKDYELARRYQEMSIETSREHGDNINLSNSLHNLGIITYQLNDFATARDLQCEALEILHAIGEKTIATYTLDKLAQIALKYNHAEWAAQVFGAADSLRASIGAKVPPIEQRELSADIEQARKLLGEETFNEMWSRGRAMTADQATAFALAGSRNQYAAEA